MVAVQGIDEVIANVNAMLQNVKSTDFNIFDKDLSLEWSRVVAEFKHNNELVNGATRDLIDTSFRKLRSAEGAFELLQNFKSIESKGAIKEQMANKLNDILDQFSREIDLVRRHPETACRFDTPEATCVWLWSARRPDAPVRQLCLFGC